MYLVRSLRSSEKTRIDRHMSPRDTHTQLYGVMRVRNVHKNTSTARGGWPAELAGWQAATVMVAAAIRIPGGS